MGNSLLGVESVSVSFKEKLVLNKITFNLESCDILHLKGTNGSGKTTLFKCLTKEINYSGNILINGRNIRSKGLNKVIFISDKNDNQLNLRVVDLIEFFLSFHGWKYSKIKPALVVIASVLDLSNQLNDLINVLSKGTLHKLYLILGILCKPDILILDEPFDGLDSDSRDLLYNALSLYAKKGGALIYSNHDESTTQNLPNLIYDLNTKTLTRGEKVELSFKPSKKFDLLKDFL
jgi:ABC-type multidrug transport system ATPase subunit